MVAISTTSAAMSFIHKLSFAHQQGIKEEEDELETAKAQMGEVREENERLKMMLQKIDKDYQSLRLRFNVLREEYDSGKATDSEAELVSLCLGMSTDPKIKKDGKDGKNRGGDDLIKTSLSLGLDSKFQLMSTENSSEEPSKVLKTMRTGDDEGSQQALVKRARVSVRVRCDTQTVNDGCQWRKYGQKIAKGNPCPRGYYRCTVAPGCPVRKQVQRCMEDMSILITTYEGTHNHSLPMSATAMASTTSAAASMLLSGSSSTSLPSTTATQALFNGSNYRQFCNSPSFPTITLDLTSSPSSSYSTQFMNQFPSSTQRYPSADLGFSSLESNMIWANKSDFRSLNFGQHSQLSFYQPNMEKTHPPPQQFLTDTLTRAITSDPSLCSAIEAAISSMARD